MSTHLRTSLCPPTITASQNPLPSPDLPPLSCSRAWLSYCENRPWAQEEELGSSLLRISSPDPAPKDPAPVSHPGSGLTSPSFWQRQPVWVPSLPLASSGKPGTKDMTAGSLVGRDGELKSTALRKGGSEPVARAFFIPLLTVWWWLTRKNWYYIIMWITHCPKESCTK